MAPSFTTTSRETKNFGTSAYVAVNLKEIEGGAEDGLFVLLERGYYAADGQQRWTKFVTLPGDPDVLKFVRSELAKIEKQLRATRKPKQGALPSADARADVGALRAPRGSGPPGARSGPLRAVASPGGSASLRPPDRPTRRRWPPGDVSFPRRCYGFAI